MTESRYQVGQTVRVLGQTATVLSAERIVRNQTGQITLGHWSYRVRMADGSVTFIRNARRAR